MNKEIVPLMDREVRVYELNTGDRSAVRTVSRAILAGLLHIDPREIVFDYTEQGKPLLRHYRDLHFSTSHSEAAALVAVSTVAAVGVDIEQIRDVPNATIILRRFFPEHEIQTVLAVNEGVDERFMQAWTRAEASVKVRGASVWEMAMRDPNVTVRNIEVIAGYAGAVAVESDDWFVTYERVVV